MRVLRAWTPNVRFADFAWPVATLSALLVFWEAVVRFHLVPAYILPAPSGVAMRLVRDGHLLLGHAVVTGSEILLGFACAVGGGVFFAVAAVYVKPFEKGIYPWLVASQAIPKVALGPLFVLWLGFGLAPKVVIAFLIAFFPVLISTVIGLKSVQTESIYLLRSMGAGRWAMFIYLTLPNSLPNLFGGMKVAITLAVVGAVVGEFIGADRGLGYVLIVANGLMDPELAFSALVLISLLAVVFYILLVLIENLCIGSWHVSKRRDLTSFSM